MSCRYLAAHELGRDQEEFLEKNFKYIFLGKWQSANSSQINKLNTSNACLFCSTPFLGFKVTNKCLKQTPNILDAILNFNLEEKMWVYFIFF